MEVIAWQCEMIQLKIMRKKASNTCSSHETFNGFNQNLWEATKQKVSSFIGYLRLLSLLTNQARTAVLFAQWLVLRVSKKLERGSSMGGTPGSLLSQWGLTARDKLHIVDPVYTCFMIRKFVFLANFYYYFLGLPYTRSVYTELAVGFSFTQLSWPQR